MDKLDIKSLNLKELQTELQPLQLPKFKVAQIYKWLHRGVRSFAEMSDLSKSLRNRLSELYFIPAVEIERKLISKIDGTVKYLCRLFDGEYIETVLMEYKHGFTICISTQVGCKMNCSFCATGQGGFSRNLLPSEMLGQIQGVSLDTGKRISNVVMMGMGEPLDNYENVLKFLELVSSEQGMNIGMRHISLSTCGIVDKIYDLANRKLQLTLSVSIHASNDEVRDKILPVNRKWNLNELLKACKYYYKMTNRRISFEYAMISGINDSDNCAAELANKLKGILAHVNLIPVNDVTGTGYRKSIIERQKKFMNILQSAGFTATIRRTLGADIEASCGQLRRKIQEDIVHDN